MRVECLCCVSNPEGRELGFWNEEGKMSRLSAKERLLASVRLAWGSELWEWDCPQGPGCFLGLTLHSCFSVALPFLTCAVSFLLPRPSRSPGLHLFFFFLSVRLLIWVPLSVSWHLSPSASQEAEGVLASGFDLAAHKASWPMHAALSVQSADILTG